APAAPEPVLAPPRQLAPVATASTVDAATLAQVQANLRALGYAAGKSTDTADPAFQRALISFQRDQGLPEDGLLTASVIEKLRVARAALRSPVAPPAGIFVYGGSGGRQALTLTSPPEGFSSDAPANFLMPLRPGKEAVLHLTRKGGETIAITCRAGKLATTALPLGTFETVAVDCRGDGAKAPQWRDLFSPRLGVVMQRQSRGVAHDLVAMQPVTAGWPAAVRTGLDWAISHALDEPSGSSSLQWSSTAVAPRFDIKVTGRIKGAEAGLGQAHAVAVCRRFELVQTGAKASYPGIACENSGGDWVLPGANIS